MKTIKESILRKMEELEQAEVNEVLKNKELSLQEMLDEQAELFAMMLGELEDRLIKKIDEKMQVEPVVELSNNILTGDRIIESFENSGKWKELEDNLSKRVYGTIKAQFKKNMGEK
ncbi:MAG: hypothetical protein GX947_07670 [Tissierellia bacterium]|nr:hypothetical protein [Tissierellia bacterium]